MILPKAEKERSRPPVLLGRLIKFEANSTSPMGRRTSFPTDFYQLAGLIFAAMLSSRRAFGNVSVDFIFNSEVVITKSGFLEARNSSPEFFN